MTTNHDSFFAEPVDPTHEARFVASEVVCRLLIWMSEAASLEEATLEEIGHVAGRSKQAVHHMANSFRETTGLAS
jgi:hypothetical protein